MKSLNFIKKVNIFTKFVNTNAITMSDFTKNIKKNKTN